MAGVSPNTSAVQAAVAAELAAFETRRIEQDTQMRMLDAQVAQVG